MPMQAKAEGVKLFHAKAQLWALLGVVLVLLWFANSGTMYFMVAGDLLNPLDSIGFFKDVAMGSGRSGLQLVRSSQSLTVFSWLIPVNLCVAQFASERRARTDEFVRQSWRTVVHSIPRQIRGGLRFLPAFAAGLLRNLHYHHSHPDGNCARARNSSVVLRSIGGKSSGAGGFPGIGVGPYTLDEKPCCCGTGDQYSAVGRSAALSGTV